jgi:hypothetical protein
MRLEEVEEMKKNNNEKEKPSGNVEVTIQSGSSVFKNGEYQGTNYYFHVREFGERTHWYKGNLVLKIRPESLDLAAMEVEKMHRDGLYHKFGECKKIA